MADFNKVLLMGRFTKDPELQTVGDDIFCVNYTLAVNKPTKKEHPEASFIDCVSWRATAENICKFFKKGSRILVEGYLDTSTYEKDGVTRKITKLVVEQFYFCDSKKSDDSEEAVSEDAPF